MEQKQNKTNLSIHFLGLPAWVSPTLESFSNVHVGPKALA